MSIEGKIRPIRRKSLHEELAESIAEMIVDGSLSSGTKIPERELSEVFGVSRTPLREALKVLAAEGLVTLEPNRGAWVSEITAEELKEVFPVMGAMEALSGELACARITDAEIAELERLQAEMLQHYRNREMARYFRTNQAIHEAILNAARNNTLTSHYRTLAVKVRRARYVANMTEARWKQAVEEHEEMLVALRARDAAALSDVMKRHLANKMETVREWLMRQAQ